MNDYTKVAFHLSPYTEMNTDLLVDTLAHYGYESFEPTDDGTNAYIPSKDFDTEAIETAISEADINTSVTWEVTEIKGIDWNEEWEKNYFKPMTIADRCVIHSTFHVDYPKLEYEIIIDPKMAFGTGHHETTSLMVEQLLQENICGRTVIDMGTGTGILAILASMCEAEAVTGIEIDEAAYLNAIENVGLNHVTNVTLLHGDATALVDVQDADLLLANINRNIITADLYRYLAVLKHGGTMLLSGFYTDDIPIVMQTASPLGLEQILYKEKNHWAILKLYRP